MKKIFMIFLAMIASLGFATAFSYVPPTDNFIVTSNSITYTPINITYLNFDGVNDFVNISAPIGSNLLSTNFTLSLWVFPLNNLTGQFNVFDFDTKNNQAWAMTLTNSKINTGVFDGSVYKGIRSSSNELTLNAWNHIIYQFNGDNQTGSLWVNNVSQTGTTQPQSGVAQFINTLGSRATLANYFNGSIDDLRIYKKTLSASERNNLTGRREIANTTSLGFTRLNTKLWTGSGGISQHGMECVDMTLYMTGGLNCVTGNCMHTDSFYKYDIKTGVLTNLTSLPNKTQSEALRAVGGNLYKFGGVNLSNVPGVYYNESYKYNTTTNTWTAITPIPIFPREDMGSGVVGNIIYLFGGNDPYLNSTNSTIAYNTTSNTWSIKADMPVSKWSGDFGVAVGDTIYAFSSAINLTQYPNMTSMTNRSFAYNTTANTWSEIAQTPLALAYKEVEEYNGNLYIFGGVTAPNTSSYNNTILEYNIAGNSWRILPNKFTYLTAFTASAKCSDGYVYTSGGIVGADIFKFGNLSDDLYNLRMNENTGTMLYDSSPYAQTGELKGATWGNDGINLTTRGYSVPFTLTGLNGEKLQWSNGTILNSSAFGNYTILFIGADTLSILSSSSSQAVLDDSNICPSFMSGVSNIGSAFVVIGTILGIVMVFAVIGLLLFIYYRRDQEINMPEITNNAKLVGSILIGLLIFVFMMILLIIAINPICTI